MASDTCTKMVGEGIFLVGAVTGNPIVMAIGGGVMAGVDAPDCAGGSAMGCVNLALDAAALTAAAPGLSDAVGRSLGQLLSDETGSLRLGRSAEEAAGIVKNTSRIDSATRSANFRVPDEYLRDLRRMSEVKFRSRLYLADSAQLRDYRAIASRDGLSFTLYVNRGTKVSQSLQGAIDSGAMKLQPYDLP